MFSKNEISEIFQRFSKLKVLIIGDVMVDNYILGKVERVSPEAPVPVVDITGNDSRLGGAGNVALNIKALGATPVLCTVIGEDKEGDLLIDLLNKEGISTEAIVLSKHRKTTTKTRVIGNNHQLIRIDHEDKSDLNSEDSKKLEVAFKKALKVCEIVIFEDYNKGVLHKGNIEPFIKIAKGLNIPTVVDPKKENFLEYKGTTLFKPNLKELREGLNYKDHEIQSLDEIKSAILALENILNNRNTMVTLSERGVIISDSQLFEHRPAHLRNIADVSGAGDTVIAVASLCVALGLQPVFIAELSNLAGGLVCEKRGVVPIDPETLKTEAIRVYSNG